MAGPGGRKRFTCNWKAWKHGNETRRGHLLQPARRQSQAEASGEGVIRRQRRHRGVVEGTRCVERREAAGDTSRRRSSGLEAAGDRTS